METCRAEIEWVRGHYPEVHHCGAHDEKTDFHLLSLLDVGQTDMNGTTPKRCPRYQTVLTDDVIGYDLVEQQQNYIRVVINCPKNIILNFDHRRFSAVVLFIR